MPQSQVDIETEFCRYFRQYHTRHWKQKKDNAIRKIMMGQHAFPNDKALIDFIALSFVTERVKDYLRWNRGNITFNPLNAFAKTICSEMAARLAKELKADLDKHCANK